MDEAPNLPPDAESAVAEILAKVEAFTTPRLERRLYPHPLDDEMKTLIDLWPQIPEARRTAITDNLTEMQNTRLFEFSHRRAREATEATDREGKLRAMRYGILALVVEGVRHDPRSTFLSIEPFFGQVRPSRLVAPIYDEAYALAEGPAKEYFAQFLVADPKKKG